MTAKHTVFATLLATTFLTTSAMAETSIPGLDSTIDRIRAESITYLDSDHPTYQLSPVDNDLFHLAVNVNNQRYLFSDDGSLVSDMEWYSLLDSSVDAIETSTPDNAWFVINQDGTDKYYTLQYKWDGSPMNPPEGYQTIRLQYTDSAFLNGNLYYYNAEDDYVNNLIAIGANALRETTDGETPLFTIGENGYTYDPSKLPSSGYSLSPAEAESDKTITLFEVDDDTKQLTPKYYTLNYPTEYGSGDNVRYYKWVKKQAEGWYGTVEYTVMVEMGEDEDHSTADIIIRHDKTYGSGDNAKYYKWVKEQVEGRYGTAEYIVMAAADSEADAEIIARYQQDHERIENSSAIDAINADFVGHVLTDDQGNGGAIYNAESGTIGSIRGNFIGNSVSDQRGGAIYNAGEIGSIDGNFIGNYLAGIAGQGDAIYNDESGTIGSISGNFIGSSYSYDGGMITNAGEIKSISGRFLVGAGHDESYSMGPTISNYGHIGSITADFLPNSPTDNIYTPIIDNRGTIDSISGDFIGHSDRIIYASGWDGGTVGSISGRFIGNGSVISSGEGGYIGSISGDFIGNTAVAGESAQGVGAVVFIIGSDIGSISGDFINNTASEDFFETDGGAAISLTTNFNAINVNSISGNFIGNTGTSGGSAIQTRSGNIGSISGNFINNSTLRPDGGYGAAISAPGGSATVNSLVGNFIGNHIDTQVSGQGGAINTGGGLYVNSLTANFIGNYVSVTGGYAEARGGAIGDPSGGFDSTLTNSSFYDNYAQAIGEEAYARGGAILSADGGYTIMADNGVSTFRGNYTDTNGEIDDNAIHFMGNSYPWDPDRDYEKDNTITLSAINNGVINMYDNISGEVDEWIQQEYPEVKPIVALTGDESGTINLYNNIYGSEVRTLGDVMISTANDDIRAYDFQSMISDANTRYEIDVNLDGDTPLADSFQTTELSSGVLTLDNLNFGGETDFSNLPEKLIGHEFALQIINNQNADSTLELALSDNLIGDAIRKIGTSTSDEEIEEVVADNTWDKDYFNHVDVLDIYGTLALSASEGSEVNDSITLVLDHSQPGANADIMLGDTLAMVAQAQLEERNFSTDDAEAVYTLGQRYEEAVGDEYVEGIGELAAGTMTVSGAVDGDNRSTLDLNFKQGFEVGEETTLNLKNIEVKNALQTVVNAGGESSVVNLTNVNLIDNIGDNGVVESDGEVNVSADGASSRFYNKAADNGIYMTGGTLTLSALNGGSVTFDDKIGGDGYDLNIYGDGSGEVLFNNTVVGANNFGLGKNSVTHLGIDAQINAESMRTINNRNLGPTADNSPLIMVDVEVDKAQNVVHSGQINIAGDVEGDYRVLVNSLNPDVLDNPEDAIVPFLFAEEDDQSTSSGFSVARVIGSPYLWDGSVEQSQQTGSTWYLNMTDKRNPDYNPEVIIAPEVAAALGLHEAAIEQTRSVTRNVRNKVASTRGYCPGCGNYPHAWDGKTLRNIWVLAQGETANIEKPTDMDADIWGVEAGFDIQNDVNNTLGVFASYRKGEYDLSGKTSRYLRTTGSEIDINSWLSGLYYRYDKNMNWLFATVYGGVQKAKAKTDDGIANFKTDGVELGASAEIGHTFALTNSLTLDPSLGVFYTQVDFDKVHDNVGKDYNWKNIKHAEAELGAKLTKQFDNAKVYVKPSVIQTFTGDDRVKVSGLGKADTYHDQTLGRIEIGGDYSFTDALTGYTWANYTFGSSYDAFAGGVGLNYAW